MKKKMKTLKPGKGPQPHGATKYPQITDIGRREYAVHFPTTVACDFHDFPVAYYKPKDIRALGEWLIQAADWIEAQE